MHRKRWKPAGSLARRRRAGRAEIQDLAAWFTRMPEPLLSALYKAMGGQPGRVGDTERMVQLTVRALTTGSRLGAVLSQIHQRDRQALAALVQCGGIAHADELHRELAMMLGGREQDWIRTMRLLGDRGLVVATDTVQEGFYYLVPEPLIDYLLPHLEEDLALSTFQHDDIRVMEQRPFCPPLDFSIATLATYMDQKPPRLTQRQEVFKGHKDELDKFFAQVWAPDSELFGLHYDFLMMHGMVELRGDRLAVNRDVLEEWLNMEPEEQRDLIFRSLDARFPMAEWVLWAVLSGKGEWIPEAPLQALYRRWRRGEDWRDRFHKGLYNSPRNNERDGFSFTPLVASGMLELGTWGQQKFYRLSPRAQRLLEPPDDEGFTQFYLTPNYEIIAPAGLAPIMLFRIGELAELVGCDRANTYRITEVSIEQALQKGWRREEVLDFLRENSQIGLPENVEKTLRGWMGADADVEFHEVMMLTVQRASVRAFESVRALKPLLLHRFAPGLYAVDKKRLPDLASELLKHGFSPAREIRRYPADQETLDARERLHHLLAKAREEREEPVARAHSADTQPEDLRPVPGSGVGQSMQPKPKKKLEMARATPAEIRALIDRVIAQSQLLGMEYFSLKDQSRKDYVVLPEKVALNREGAAVLVATDTESGSRLSFALTQIWRARPLERDGHGG